MTLEKADPRVKLALLLMISTVCVATRRIALLMAVLLFTLALLLLLKADLRGALARVKPAIKLILSVFLLQCVFNRAGDPLIAVLGVTLVTAEGARMAAVVTLRLLCVLLSAVIVMSGQPRDYLLALTQCRVPYEIAFMVQAGLRFLPSLREEAQDVMAAVQMRGVNIKKLPLSGKLKVYLRVMVPIVARTIRRSEQMSVAMEARAFRALNSRSNMRRLTMKKTDWALMILSTALLALLIVGV